MEAAYPDCRCIEAESIQEARIRLTERPWDLMILDLQLADGDGLTFLRSMKSPPPTIVLTMFEAPGLRINALQAGAKAFATKSIQPARFKELVQRVIDGETPPPEQIRSKTDSTQLSEREQEVLKGILAGKRLSEIAREQGISSTAVQSYKNRLFSKLGTTSNAELFQLALRQTQDGTSPATGSKSPRLEMRGGLLT